MTKKWIKLSKPAVGLNAPNVSHKFPGKYSYVVPWEKSAHEIIHDYVPGDAWHLVFNCHGFASRPNFPVPHLALGTVFHAANVSAFVPLAAMPHLHVIWLAACNIAVSAEGSSYCTEIARTAKSYVVAYTMAVPDVTMRAGYIEDFQNSMPVYFGPDGNKIARSAFLEKGASIGL